MHHIQETDSMIEGVGAIVHFCSPDLNPIEECFSKVKSEIKEPWTLATLKSSH